MSAKFGKPAGKVETTREEGFSYLWVMSLVVIIGIGLTVVGYQWKTMAKREKEKELLFRGDQIRAAITEYTNADPLRRRPGSLEDLVRDPRSPNPKSYLRKIYKDPITDKDFILIRDPVSGLVGVRSRSRDKPLKIANFSGADLCFEGKKQYREWLFVAAQGTLVQTGTALSAGTSATTQTGTGVRVPLPSVPCPPADLLSDDQE